jgi:hypothetical protein
MKVTPWHGSENVGSICKVGNFAYLLVELSNSANKVLPDHDTVIHLVLRREELGQLKTYWITSQLEIIPHQQMWLTVNQPTQSYNILHKTF